MIKKLWHWLLIKNPLGLACILTAWGLGAVYVALAFTGLVSGLNAPLVMQFCGIAGLALFLVMPLLAKLFRL